jgi:hypothetical protein
VPFLSLLIQDSFEGEGDKGGEVITLKGPYDKYEFIDFKGGRW